MEIFEKLIGYFLKLPGIGPRQAKRFAYFLASQDENFLKDLSVAILDIKNKIKQCPECFKLHSEASEKCLICSGLNRDKFLLMIIEKDVDIESIERAGVYNGRYFVLGSTISLTDDKIDNIRFKKLFDKIKQGEVKEIIIALSANIEGENTARYIEKILEPLKIKVTRLGRGLSTGTELEYSDSETIKNALEGRK
jgi:recombination protein RecR